MMLFACDLDNTLIHSYKVAKPYDVCVETKDGKELSFISSEAYALLKDVSEICTLVPVTTRSLEQYRRIDLGISSKYAIVAHGALLLVDGEVDEQWSQELHRVLNITLPAIEPTEHLIDIRSVENTFIFAKSDDPQAAVRYLKTFVDSQVLDVCAVHNKVYILPKKLNKGEAVTRLKGRIGNNFLICAGDSELDLSMLKISDMALAPYTLRGKLNNLRTFDAEDFAADILSCVLKLA
jgi:hydroxymethylpyrimidine pyrophosphatase-like HAD family hydrolase